MSAQRGSTNVVLNFTGRLQSSSHVDGPYTNVAGARSPRVALESGASSQFWRAVLNDVRLIAAGGGHSAALRADGTLWMWGNNSAGQLGLGTNVGTNRPVQVGTETNWQSVVAGHGHTMALRVDGTLWAWGANASGQLGIGTTDNAYTPIQVGTNTDWESVAAGRAHTLAIRADGTLWAWGDNRDGQLGIGNTNNAHQPVQVGSASKWLSAAAGGGPSDITPMDLIFGHSAGLRDDGTLWVWGDNRVGQLGTETYSGTTQPVRVGTNIHWQAVSAGGRHTAALDADGFLWAWGDDWDGQLGVSNVVDRTNRPQRADGSGRWQAISIGGKHTMALRVDGTLWACGAAANGRLGVPTTVTEYGDRYVPGIGAAVRLTQVGTNVDWKAVAAGEAQTLALRTDGTLWAWGYDRFGQLGTLTQIPDEQPFQLLRDAKWKSVTAGGGHAVALRDDGTLWAWGWNERGQLGIGTFFDANDPTQIGTNADWRMVSAGQTYTAAIRTDGTLWAWGWNNSGQLGNGTERTTNSPVQVGTDSNWRMVSAGGDYLGAEHTVAIRDDGTLWAWGNNRQGQLGIGNFTPSTTNVPVQVGTDDNWRWVSAGVRHTVAIRTDGTLWTWGGYPALGLGDNIPSTKKPAQVGTDANWQTAGAGELFTAAIRTDGTLWVWGQQYVNTNRPVQFGTDANWKTLSVQGSSALALRNDRTMWWFTNGGLVQETTAASWDAAAVGKAIQIGFSCAVTVRDDGTLWFWDGYFPGRPGRPVSWLPYPVPGADWWLPGN